MLFIGFVKENLLLIFLLIVAISINVALKKRMGPYEYAIKHILAYTFFVVPIIFFILKKLIYILQQDAGNYSYHLLKVIDSITLNVISNYIILIAFASAFIIERHIKNRYEDGEKLTQDYSSLVELYKKEGKNLVSSGDTVYPVVSIGKGDVCVYIKDQEIKVKEHVEICDRKTEYALPGLIEKNFSEIIKVHDSSVLYNNSCIRAIDMEINNNVLKLTTERTYYYYSMVTNRASDYDWAKDGVTVRSLYEPGPFFQPLSHSYMSNHLGFNGFVVTKDNYVVFVKRSKDLSIAKRTYGDSLGASLKTKYALDEDGFFTEEKMVDAIFAELKDELKLEKDDITEVHIISVYRDGLESGKPQFLMYAKTNLNAEEMGKQFFSVSDEKIKEKIKTNKKWKENKKLKDEQKVIKDGSKLVWIRTDLLPQLQFEIDEVKYVGEVKNCEGFFEISPSGYVNPLKKQSLPMVPSASASLVMFQRYLQS